MTTNLAVLQSYLKAIDAHDADGVRSAFAANATVQAPGVSLDGVHAITDWIGVFWRAFPDLNHEVVTSLESGDLAAAEVWFSGTHTGPLASPDDWSWRPSLFNGRARAVARRPGAARPLGRACRAEHIRLDQMIPAAGSAHFHHVYGELLVAGCQQDQLFGGAGRARYRTQMFAEHPRHQGQLFLPADRAHHLARFPMKLRGTQQIGVRVTHLGHTRAARVDLGQHRAPPKRVVHHLSLQSHGDQSTSPAAPPTRNQGCRAN